MINPIPIAHDYEIEKLKEGDLVDLVSKYYGNKLALQCITTCFYRGKRPDRQIEVATKLSNEDKDLTIAVFRWNSKQHQYELNPFQSSSIKPSSEEESYYLEKLAVVNS